MVKILHFADTHLGMENYGRIDPQTGLNSRLFDFLASFDALVDFAKRNKPDLILFAGDAYKTREPSQTYQREFAHRVKKLSEISPVVLILGNHDSPVTLSKATTLDIFSTLAPANVFISSEAEILKIPTRTRESIQVASCPWISKSQLTFKEENKGKSIEEIKKEAALELVKKIKKLGEKIDKNLPSVLLAHLTVSGAIFGSEQSVMLGHDVVIPQDVLENSPFDYIGLGHLHRYQVLSETPPIVYSGSIERIDFSEEKEEKGFLWVEISENKTKFKFIPLPARKFLTIRCELKEKEDPTAQVLKEIKNYKLKRTVVRLILSGKKDTLAKINYEEMRKIASSCYYFNLIREPEEESREKIATSLEELSPLEVLERYLLSKKTPRDKIKILKKEGQKLIEEAELSLGS